MKTFYCITLFILVLVSCKTVKNDRMGTGELTSEYDSLLAAELGADSYGMKTYVMAFLRRGDSISADSTTAAKLQRAHLDNITRLAENGNLILAGPFMDEGDLRGIYIFNVSSIDEARELTRSDPAIRAGVLKMELHRWYGSAALQKLNEIHSTLQSDSI